MQRFLLDTNELIPLEPTSPADIEAGTPIAAEVARLANELGFQLLRHPLTSRELQKDPNPTRREARQMLLAKYPQLTQPPSIDEVEQILGVTRPDSNDWVDNHLLAALYADAVHYLVTNDDKMHRKAQRLRIPSDRVLTLADARAFLNTLVDHPQTPPPQVQLRPLHALRQSDSIFNSLRGDYPGFDDWFARVSREGRQAWSIEPDGGGCAGICIWKPNDDEYDLGGKVMKISTFKVADEHRGRRYGELLLKTTFNDLRANRYNHVWLTVFEHHGGLITMLEDFGFYQLPHRTALRELVYAKQLVPGGAAASDAFEYHHRYGPPAIDLSLSPVYVIPIQPRYHRRLFPDDPLEQMLMPGDDPFGNAIRKAYLSQSAVQPPPRGAVILFYRSADRQAINAVGIVEETMRSADASEIARFAGQRTVYTYAEIEELAQQQVLTILFRQDRLLEEPWGLQDLIDAQVLNGPPQSITQVHNEEALQWLSDRLAASP